MRLKLIIGVLTLLLLMVGTASAESQTVTLTEDNSNVNRDDPGTLPDGIINVKVTYNPGTGIITYTDMSPTSGSVYLVNPRIDEVAYNLERDGSVTSGGYWGLTHDSSMDGFGDFNVKLAQSPRNVWYRSVTVDLNEPTPYPSFPSSGHAVAIHLKFDKAYDGTTLIMENGDANLGSTFLAGGVTEVPEFSTIALPIAAILGLMFIFGRRKQE